MSTKKEDIGIFGADNIDADAAEENSGNNRKMTCDGSKCHFKWHDT